MVASLNEDNPYLALRRAKIARNEKRLRELGLVKPITSQCHGRSAVQQRTTVEQVNVQSPPTKKRKRVKHAASYQSFLEIATSPPPGSAQKSNKSVAKTVTPSPSKSTTPKPADKHRADESSTSSRDFERARKSVEKRFKNGAKSKEWLQDDESERGESSFSEQAKKMSGQKQFKNGAKSKASQYDDDESSSSIERLPAKKKSIKGQKRFKNGAKSKELLELDDESSLSSPIEHVPAKKKSSKGQKGSKARAETEEWVHDDDESSSSSSIEHLLAKKKFIKWQTPFKKGAKSKTSDNIYYDYSTDESLSESDNRDYSSDEASSSSSSSSKSSHPVKRNATKRTKKQHAQKGARKSTNRRGTSKKVSPSRLSFTQRTKQEESMAMACPKARHTAYEDDTLDEFSSSSLGQQSKKRGRTQQSNESYKYKPSDTRPTDDDDVYEANDQKKRPSSKRKHSKKSKPIYEEESDEDTPFETDDGDSDVDDMDQKKRADPSKHKVDHSKKSSYVAESDEDIRPRTKSATSKASPNAKSVYYDSLVGSSSPAKQQIWEGGRLDTSPTDDTDKTTGKKKHQQMLFDNHHKSPARESKQRKLVQLKKYKEESDQHAAFDTGYDDDYDEVRGQKKRPFFGQQTKRKSEHSKNYKSNLKEESDVDTTVETTDDDTDETNGRPADNNYKPNYKEDSDEDSVLSKPKYDMSGSDYSDNDFDDDESLPQSLTEIMAPAHILYDQIREYMKEYELDPNEMKFLKKWSKLVHDKLTQQNDLAVENIESAAQERRIGEEVVKQQEALIALRTKIRLAQNEHQQVENRIDVQKQDVSNRLEASRLLQAVDRLRKQK